MQGTLWGLNLKNNIEPMRSQLRDYLKQIQYVTYEIKREVTDVVRQIVGMGILTEKSFDDCQHIGAIVINECGFIISWNFKHIVNVKTIREGEQIFRFCKK